MPIKGTMFNCPNGKLHQIKISSSGLNPGKCLGFRGQELVRASSSSFISWTRSSIPRSHLTPRSSPSEGPQWDPGPHLPIFPSTHLLRGRGLCTAQSSPLCAPGPRTLTAYCRDACCLAQTGKHSESEIFPEQQYEKPEKVNVE